MESTASALLCPRCGREGPGPLGALCPKDGAALVTPAVHAELEQRRDPIIGRVIGGRFPVVGLIGRGAYGTVYRAVQLPIGREVALKVMNTPRDEELRSRFFREAHVVARLSHPSAVTLFDYGQDADGLLYMVLEYIRGRTLREVVQDEAPLAPARAARLTLQVLGALVEAHGIGLIHRDLKPANIMLSREKTGEERAKVLDFGMAKVLEGQDLAAGDEATRTGLVVGTPRYLSPEQAMARQVGPPTDVYALGVILYEMLSGEPPFVAPSTFELLVLHTTAEIPPLDAALRVPPAMEAVMRRAMAKPVEERFSDAQAMLDALRAASVGAPTEAAVARAPRTPDPAPAPDELSADALRSVARQAGRLVPGGRIAEALRSPGPRAEAPPAVDSGVEAPASEAGPAAEVPASEAESAEAPTPPAAPAAEAPALVAEPADAPAPPAEHAAEAPAPPAEPPISPPILRLRAEPPTPRVTDRPAPLAARLTPPGRRAPPAGAERGRARISAPATFEPPPLEPDALDHGMSATHGELGRLHESLEIEVAGRGRLGAGLVAAGLVAVGLAGWLLFGQNGREPALPDADEASAATHERVEPIARVPDAAAPDAAPDAAPPDAAVPDAVPPDAAPPPPEDEVNAALKKAARAVSRGRMGRAPALVAEADALISAFIAPLPDGEAKAAWTLDRARLWRRLGDRQSGEARRASLLRARDDLAHAMTHASSEVNFEHYKEAVDLSVRLFGEHAPETLDFACAPAHVGDYLHRGNICAVLRIRAGNAADDPARKAQLICDGAAMFSGDLPGLGPKAQEAKRREAHDYGVQCALARQAVDAAP